MTVRRYFERVDQRAIAKAYPPPPDHLGVLRARLHHRPSENLSRLKTVINNAWTRPFYRNRWSDVGFEPGDLKTLEDLALLPAFTVNDLRESIAADPPFGTHQRLTGPEGPVDRVLFSGGTTGSPRPVIHSARDREIGELIQARHQWAAGIRASDVVMVSFGYGPHNAAATMHEGLYRWLGCLVIPASTGNVTSSVKQVTMAREYGATAWIGMSDYITHLAKVAADMGLDPVADFKVRTVIAGGDPKAAAAVWGAEGFGIYGTYELQTPAGECRAHDGLHYSSDAYIVEVVDVDRWSPLPRGDVGNLVFTSLYNEAFPIVRFNTLDRSYLFADPACACGDPSDKFAGFLGRSDTMLKLRGINVWPEEVGAIACEQPGSNGEFICLASRVGSEDRLLVRLEMAAKDPSVADRIGQRLKDRLGVRIDVEVVAMGDLAAQTGLGVRAKPVRFVDLR